MHKVVFTGCGWTCTACGKAFRSRRAALSGECAGMLPAALLAHPTHQVHFATFEDRHEELPLVLCTRCGAHGTSKVANLAAPCPAVSSEARPRNAPYRRQAAAVAKMMHPSRRGVQLHDLRAVPPGLRAIAWGSLREREALACRPEVAAEAPLPAATPAEPPLAAAAHAANAAAIVEGEVGTGQPLEELVALEAQAAQAAEEVELPMSDEELGFGGFDD